MDTLEQVLGHQVMREIALRADAAANVAHVARKQWRDPSGFNDKHLVYVTDHAARVGLTEAEICHIIDTTRKEEHGT